MPGKRRACIIDNALMHRRGNQCIEATVKAAVHALSQHVQHIIAVSSVKFAGDAGYAQRHMYHFNDPGKRRQMYFAKLRVVITYRCGDAQFNGAPLDQGTVAKHHQPRAKVTPG